jgi:8-oxo-dGTP pyrophosphatase MutT (NUDIX family)
VPLSVSVRRLGYRLAYRVLQVVWLVTRPSQKGVKCLLWHGGEILLVRHTYGDRGWDLPGGMVKRGEHPEDTARREMHEELGIRAPQWADLGSVSTSIEHRHDTIHVFGAELVTPSVKIERSELDVAQWFAPGELPPMRPLGAQILHHALPLVLSPAA